MNVLESPGNIRLPEDALNALVGLQDAIEAIAQALQRISSLGRIAMVLHRSKIATEIKELRQDLALALQTFRVSLSSTW